MIEEIFSRLPDDFRPAILTRTLTYYFSLGEVRKTVTLGPETVKIEDGKTVDEADCVCKTDEVMFLKIWQDGYMPGMQDFMTGRIKSNNPMALKDFLVAFGKG